MQKTKKILSIFLCFFILLTTLNLEGIGTVIPVQAATHTHTASCYNGTKHTHTSSCESVTGRCYGSMTRQWSSTPSTEYCGTYTQYKYGTYDNSRTPSGITHCQSGHAYDMGVYSTWTEVYCSGCNTEIYRYHRAICPTCKTLHESPYNFDYRSSHACYYVKCSGCTSTNGTVGTTHTKTVNVPLYECSTCGWGSTTSYGSSCGRTYTSITCGKTDGAYYNGSTQVSPSCNTIITGISPVKSSQTITSPNDFNKQVTVTYLDGHTATATATSTTFNNSTTYNGSPITLTLNGKSNAAGATNNFTAITYVTTNYSKTVTCIDRIYNTTTNLGTAGTKTYSYGSIARGQDWGTTSPYNNAQYTYTYHSDDSATATDNVTVYRYWTRTVNNYELDVNGVLDGTSTSNTTNYITFDVYINGSLVSNDASDYCISHPYGTTYEIKDIKGATGHTYEGLYSGSLSGTITSNVKTYLKGKTNSYTVTCKDVVGSTSGKVLDTSTWTALYGSTANGASKGTSTTVGLYYEGYKYSSSTTATVGTNGATVYRIFTPQKYTVTYEDKVNDAGGTTLGSSTASIDYGTVVNGSTKGTDTTPGKYYTDYTYKASTSATVGINGATVYRYFTYTPLTANVAAYSGVYDGNPHSATITSNVAGATIKYGTTSGTYNLTTNPSFTDVGTYTVYYQISKTGYTTITGSTTVKITQKNNTLTLSATSGGTEYPNTSKHTFTVTNNESGGKLSVKSSDTSIATVSINGNTVTITNAGGKGTVTITVTSDATNNYKTASVPYTYTVSYNKETVTYVDKIVSNIDHPKAGIELKRVSKQVTYNETVKGSDIGPSTDIGAYYEGYYCTSYTEAIVPDGGTTVYRYFTPAIYNQKVYISIQNIDRSYQPEILVDSKDCYYDTTYSWSYPDSQEYNGKDVTYVVKQDTITKLDINKKQYILDVDGNLDGNLYEGLDVYGKFDVYLNGMLMTYGGTDYSTIALYGSTYEITNIRANTGFEYNGPTTISGTITEDTVITIPMTANYYKVTFQSVDIDTGEVLGEYVTSYKYGERVFGAALGTNENDNAFFYGYKYINSEEIFVTAQDNNIVKRYFKLVTVNVPYSVEWVDKSNAYNSRPDSITITLYRDGEIFKTMDGLTSNDVYNLKFTNLQKYSKEDGHKYAYALNQSDIISKNPDDKYTTTASGTKFTNALTNNQQFIVQGAITWVDDGNEGYRPANVKVELYRNGTLQTSKTLSNTATAYTFTGLDKYDEDLIPYVYTAQEVFTAQYLVNNNGVYTTLDAYDITVNGLDFTNTFIVPNGDIVPVKPEFNNRLTFNKNVSDNVNIVLKQFKTYKNDSGNTTFSTTEYNGYTYNFTLGNNTTIDYITAGRYEVVILGNKYSIKDMSLTTPDSISLTEENGTYYIEIADTNKNMSGTITLNLAVNNHVGYQTEYTSKCYFATVNYGAYIAPVAMFSMRVSANKLDEFRIIYNDSETVDNNTYRDLEGYNEAFILDFVGDLKENQEFLGWSTIKDAEDPEYYPGDVITLNETINLYPVILTDEEAEAVTGSAIKVDIESVTGSDIEVEIPSESESETTNTESTDIDSELTNSKLESPSTESEQTESESINTELESTESETINSELEQTDTEPTPPQQEDLPESSSQVEDVVDTSVVDNNENNIEPTVPVDSIKESDGTPSEQNE